MPVRLTYKASSVEQDLGKFQPLGGTGGTEIDG
jgi:hypothetical protein